MEEQPENSEKLKSLLPSVNKDIQTMEAPTFQDSVPIKPNEALPTPPALPTVPTAANSKPINPLLMASPLISRKRQLPHHLQQDIPHQVKSSPGGGASNLPIETVEYLKAWIMSPQHVGHPYPTEEEKAQIMADTGIELKQLTNWFVNNRKRYWKPRVEAHKKALAKNGPFNLGTSMDLAAGASNDVNFNTSLNFGTTTKNDRRGGKMPGRKNAPGRSTGKQRKVPTKKKGRRKSLTKYKTKANGRLKKSSIPKTTLKIVSDENPNRITNPLLATLPPKNSTDEVYGSELYRAMEVVFHPPDTYPLSYYARILGFDVPVVDDNQKMPTAFPDVATLPLISARKDDPFLEVPKEERRIEYKKVNSLGQDLDDQLTLDYVDPVYATLLREGFSTKELVPCNHSLFTKFDSRRKQGTSKQQEVVAMGKTILPSFDQNWTFSGYPASKTEGKAILEEYQWTIEENPVPSHLPPQTFGVVAWQGGKPEAILMYQFMWYSLSKETKESELVMVITGIGRPRRKPKFAPIAPTTDVVVVDDGKMLEAKIATTPEPPKESPNTEINENSCPTELKKSSAQDSTPSEVSISSPSQPPPETVQDSEKANAKSDSAPDEDAESIPISLDKTVITTMIAMILEHTRICNVFYGLWEAPENSLGFVQECFRLSKVPSRGNDISETMVCDLKKSSSRYAFLKLLESEEEKVASTKDSAEVRDRLLVRLPNMEEAKSCFEPAAALITQRAHRNSSSKGNIFTGASGTMQEATFGIRALAVQDDVSPEVKIHSLQDEKQGDQLQLPDSSGTGLNLELLKSFPIPTTQTEEKEEKCEILLDLERKQKELIQIEKGLEPKLRSLMCKIIDDRIEYEKPEARQKRADDIRILEEHRKAVERRKELDQQMQQQLEQDMNAVCSICGDGEVTPDNQILFCEACDVPVHQMCYGVERVPEGDYYCVACKHFKRDKMKQDAKRAREPMPVLPIRCELCPVQYGAYIRCELPKDAPPDAVTKWVHMGCAKWQGLNFSEPLNPECVEDVTTLKQEYRRLDYACDICKGKRGAYHRCAHTGCNKWMHMTCSLFCGLCEVNYGEDVEGHPTKKPWTLFCRQHSTIDLEEDSGYKRYSVDELVAMAKEFPEEPMPVAPPPKNRIFNKLNGKERALALANPEYERAVLDEILNKRFAGVRCECCDEDLDGSLLQRCSTCKVTVCTSCRLFPGKISADQKYIKCDSCSYKAECAKEERDFEEPQCDLCYQNGGLLMHGKAKPITRASFWKNNPKMFKKSIFGKKLWTHYSCAFWSKNVHVNAKECRAECSDVVMSNGLGYVQGKIPCYLCGKTRGMKTRCSDMNCRARGEKKQAYHFHATCARHAGYEVGIDDDASDENDRFYIRCYQHGGNEYNLRARLEDMVEVERRRSGKKFGKADAPMSFNDASRLLNCAMLVVRMLGWAWRWAELWVDHNSTWEPLLEPGQKEENMTKAQLKIIDSTPQSRCKDARRCRLTAFGAALRNRNYDEEDGFDNESLKRAFRAVLHTKSLVGPWKEFEINFMVDWLSRAYRSKSRLLGLGDDKIPIGNASFCHHADDKSPKFELGNRPLPGKAMLDEGQVFEAAVVEPDDFLKPEVIDGKEVPPTIAPAARETKKEPSASPRAVATATPARQKRGPGRPRKSPDSESVSPFDKSASLAALIPSATKKRRAPGDATETASTSKKFRRFEDKARRAHAVIQFDELDPSGPLRRGRRGRPPRLFELSVVVQVGGKLIDHQFAEVQNRAKSQTRVQMRNMGTNDVETTVEGANTTEKRVQVNGKHTKSTPLTNTKQGNHIASEPAATLPASTRKRRVGEVAIMATDRLQKASVKKKTGKATLKRSGKRGQRLSRCKINYAENSDDSEFEEESEEDIDEPVEVPRRKESAVKNATKREAHKEEARKHHIDISNDERNSRKSGKRAQERGGSSDASRRQKAFKQGASRRKVEKKEPVYESDFLVPLSDLASRPQAREGIQWSRSDERAAIDPIQSALEAFEKRAPYCVTKPGRLEGKKAAAKAAFIK